MPTSLTSSFASAAAGNGESGVNRIAGGNDWSRGRPNGATQTFRRTSQATTQSRDNSSTTGPYIPPHMNSNVMRNGTNGDTRYNKEQMLNLYHNQKETGFLNRNLHDVFQGPWDPSLQNGQKIDKDQIGAEVCWNSQFEGDPFGLVDMDENEKQLFTSVNSLVKPQTKESGTTTTRKASVSTTRPGTRRRETSDSFTNSPLSPTENKTFFRNEPNTNTPPALLRRRTDFKDEEKEDEEITFGSMKRISTGPPSAGLNGPTQSPWSAGPRSAFESMGNFGNFAVGNSAAESEKRPGFGSARGASRFKDLLTKSSVEDMSVKEKASIGALEKLPEETEGQSKLRDIFKTRPARSETNPYAEIPRGGSAALSHDEQDIEQATPHHKLDPMSPATNPYTSPTNREDDEEGQLPPLRRDMFAGSYGQPTFGAPRQLSGLGGVPGWGSAGFGSATPGRERNAVSAAFGDPIFSPMADLQSPGAGLFGTGFGSAGRSNRLGALFPPAMQDQMRSDSRNDAFESESRDPFASGARRDNIRSLFEDDQAQLVQPEQPSGHGPSPSGGSTTSNTLPTTQQRQMVMPDRMRWIYRDPSGQVQGPWSGLEMHDWFKAGFFTAELQVKKLEDAEYEPLAQLVRRIGNSREPFLVPQIGVPHGPASSNPSNHWASSMGPTGTQPPFANSFPSFGTTLTAEQQNALERRKQEEQYLMARQKEHLAQQQMYMKQMHVSNPSGGNHGLQHHASAHSLQSQPSFGSITSPGFQQAPIQPPQMDELPGMMDRINFSQRANTFGPSPIGRSQAETRAHEEAFLGQEGRNERLEEFHDLRNDQEQQPIGAQRPDEKRSETLSLTQQVQRTTAANEKAALEKYIDIPPVSISPLPAPTPNRNRQHVADQLAAESRSQSQTPVEPSSLAPWAQAELPKGQSLKEIQEAEAKRAAEQEKVNAAVRQAQEQERLAATVLIAPAPGLPATSNWAASPASPGPTNVWGSKPVPKPVSTVATKKTLAQIQKEEESRKQRAQIVQVQTTVTGKRYAELAGKESPVTAPIASSWTTVGASGKVKQTPVTVVATPQARTVSTTKPRPVLQTRTVSVSNGKKADEEFTKWARSQLDDKLNPGINVDNFIRDLLVLPAEREIIREAVYGSSKVLNGDRLSEEWLRRRKLADKGIVEPATDVSSPIVGDKQSGWNEVAKKGPMKDDSPAAAAAFKVVAKKKGRK